MKPTTTPEKLIDVLADFSGIAANCITMEMPIADLGFDSLDIAEVTFALEEDFNVHLPDTTITDCATVGDLLTAIRNA